MSTKTRLTDAHVKKIKPHKDKLVEVLDSDVQGLTLRVSPKGTKTWSLWYRYGRGGKRMKLGRYPALGVKDARCAARDALAVLAKGLDPAQERKLKAEEQVRVYDETFGSLARRFMREYERGVDHSDNPESAMPLHKTWKETDLILNKYVLPKWDKVPVAYLRRADVRALLESLSKHSKAQANKTFAIIRKLFNWAMQMDLIEMSPCVGLKKPHKSVVRNRPLKDDEIRAIWQASYEMGYPFGHTYRLLLITGQRRGEVCSMEYAELDLKHAEWILPPERTKANRRHVVPLSPLALDILESVPPIGGQFVFSTTMGTKPISGFSKAKKQLEELSGVTDFRVHDFRDTVATTMRERLSIHSDVVGQVLNHAPQGVTQRHYAANHSMEDKRTALKAWDEYLGKVIGEQVEKGNVVRFTRSR